LALTAAALISSLAVTTVMAGEITGNGRLLTVHGRSSCAFSGQEDLQWFVTDEDLVRHALTRGVPGHAQSWGQIPKADRDFLATIGMHPGDACNPVKSGGGAE
jgi:hypothetical protein